MAGNLSLIAAVGKNRELGLQGELLWHIPEDLKRFKALTLGHPVIMGRKTWKSLPERFRPLPGRTNIVVKHQAGYAAEGATVVSSLDEARAVAADAAPTLSVGVPTSDVGNEVFVIGGGMLYAAALPFANRLYLTLVDDTADADTFFPPYEQDFKIISDELGSGELPHRFLTLVRK